MWIKVRRTWSKKVGLYVKINSYWRIFTFYQQFLLLSSTEWFLSALTKCQHSPQRYNWDSRDISYGYISITKKFSFKLSNGNTAFRFKKGTDSAPFSLTDYLLIYGCWDESKMRSCALWALHLNTTYSRLLSLCQPPSHSQDFVFNIILKGFPSIFFFISLEYILRNSRPGL